MVAVKMLADDLIALALAQVSTGFQLASA